MDNPTRMTVQVRTDLLQEVRTLLNESSWAGALEVALEEFIAQQRLVQLTRSPLPDLTPQTLARVRRTRIGARA
jgi:hypothetical protein